MPWRYLYHRRWRFTDPRPRAAFLEPCSKKPWSGSMNQANSCCFLQVQKWSLSPLVKVSTSALPWLMSGTKGRLTLRVGDERWMSATVNSRLPCKGIEAQLVAAGARAIQRGRAEAAAAVQQLGFDPASGSIGCRGWLTASAGGSCRWSAPRASLVVSACPQPPRTSATERRHLPRYLPRTKCSTVQAAQRSVSALSGEWRMVGALSGG